MEKSKIREKIENLEKSKIGEENLREIELSKLKIENKSHIRKKSKIWGEWKVGKNRELVGN